MTREFNSARLKLQRAEQHLDALHSSVNAYNCGNRFIKEMEADTHTIVFRFQEADVPPHNGWSLILGDALFNLRSCLDHAIYELAVIVGGQDPPTNGGALAFPICSSETEWTRARGSKLGVLERRADIVAAVQSMQPYARPDTLTPLRFLANLNNFDKHRSLIVFSILPGDALGSFQFLIPDHAADGEIECRLSYQGNSLEHGTEIVRIKVPADWSLRLDSEVPTQLTTQPCVRRTLTEPWNPMFESLAMTHEVVLVALEHLEELAG